MKDNNFEYTYTAPTEEERREIESIRRQYEAKDETKSKIERVRQLDSFVQNFSVIIALVLGIMGTLIFGLGMSMVLVWNIEIFGIIVGAVGIIPMTAAYPVYVTTLRRNKKKYGEEILRLSEEILK